MLEPSQSVRRDGLLVWEIRSARLRAALPERVTRFILPQIRERVTAMAKCPAPRGITECYACSGKAWFSPPTYAPIGRGAGERRRP